MDTSGKVADGGVSLTHHKKERENLLEEEHVSGFVEGTGARTSVSETWLLASTKYRGRALFHPTAAYITV